MVRLLSLGIRANPVSLHFAPKRSMSDTQRFSSLKEPLVVWYRSSNDAFFMLLELLMQCLCWLVHSNSFWLFPIKVEKNWVAARRLVYRIPFFLWAWLVLVLAGRCSATSNCGTLQFLLNREGELRREHHRTERQRSYGAVLLRLNIRKANPLMVLIVLFLSSPEPMMQSP